MVVFAFVFRESIVIISAIMCNKIYLNDSLGVSKINKTAFQILYITGLILQFYYSPAETQTAHKQRTL